MSDKLENCSYVAACRGGPLDGKMHGSQFPFTNAPGDITERYIYMPEEIGGPFWLYEGKDK